MKTKKEYKTRSSRSIGNMEQKHLCTNSLIKRYSPIQRKTIVNQKGQNYLWYDKFGYHATEVGDLVEAKLDPNDMIQGQSACLNTSQNKMMSAIRNKWKIRGGGVVKGHLWNDNLGGSALNKNLYPITKAANKDHLEYVENVVKTHIYNRQPVFYRVKVDAKPNMNEPIAKFNCEIREWTPLNPSYIGGLLHSPVTILSDLRHVRAYNKAYETFTRQTPSKVAYPIFPQWLKRPKTKVSELSIFEKNLRAKQRHLN